jgi:hypothetical protein
MVVIFLPASLLTSNCACTSSGASCCTRAWTMETILQSDDLSRVILPY